uniref:Uncharacterized protein n=1 Tax=Medicago truncatula TaxID=3880 RepID=I3TAR9_MEDTR|nr:unknown [Medicago truncatula]
MFQTLSNVSEENLLESIQMFSPCTRCCSTSTMKCVL